MKERLEFLAEFLEKLGQENKEQAESEICDFIKGERTGKGNAYKLCAQWIREELEKGD